MSKTRGKKRAHGDHEEHEEHVNHEAWVIPYADMLTLLMGLFLIMFAMSRVDAEKFEKVAESLRNEFGTGGGAQVISLGGDGGSPVAGGAGIMDGGAPVTVAPSGVADGTDDGAEDGDADGAGIAGDVEDGAEAPPATPAGSAGGLGFPITTVPPPDDAEEALEDEQAAHEYARASYEELAAIQGLVTEHAQAFGLADDIGFRLEARGLVVSIVTDQVLFGSGAATLQEGGLGVLDIVADALAETDNDVAIEGHTDDRPIATTRFPSNWELSTARATSVLRYLVDRHGIDPARLSAAGYADTRPVAPNDSDAGKAANRRVELVVLSTVSLEPLLGEPGA